MYMCVLNLLCLDTLVLQGRPTPIIIEVGMACETRGTFHTSADLLY